MADRRRELYQRKLNPADVRQMTNTEARILKLNALRKLDRKSPNATRNLFIVPGVIRHDDVDYLRHGILKVDQRLGLQLKPKSAAKAKSELSFIPLFR